MPIEKEVNVIVRDNLDVAGARAVKLGQNLKKIETNNKGLTKSFKESGASILENGGAMGLLNDLTGGFAMQVKDGVESLDLFSKESAIATGAQKIYAAVVGTSTGAVKALKLAMASVGIGALLILVGYLITAFGDSAEATEEQKHQQELLNEKIAETNELMKEELEGIEFVTKARKFRAETAGASEKELRQIENEGHEERLAAIKAEQAALLQLQALKTLTPEQAKDINKRLLANNKAFIDEINNDSLRRLEQAKDDAVAQRELEKELADKRLEEWKKKEEERLQKIRDYQKETLEGLRQFNLLKIQIENEDFDRAFQAEQAKDEYLKQFYGVSDAQKIEDEKAKGLAILDAAKASASEYIDFLDGIERQKTELEAKQSEERVKIRNAEKEQKLAIQNAELDVATQGAGVLKTLAGKNKALQKTAIVIENVAAIAKVIANTVAANAKAVATSPETFGQPWVGINTASAVIGIASTALATKKALKEVGGGEGGGGGSGGGLPGGGGAAPPPPQFNIVGQNPNNQLAQSIGQSQGRPVEAYVVSGNMTNAQSLDRNRVETSTLN